MGLTDAVKTCLRKPLRFSGRATRTEFWWFLLVLALVYAGIIQALIILDNSKSYYVIKFYYVIQDFLLLVGPTGLAFFLLLLAVAFRRVHDTGRSGWHALIPALLLVAGPFGVMGVTFLPWVMDMDKHRFPTAYCIEILLWYASFGIMALGALGAAYLTYILVQRSQPGPNKYGPNPDEVPP